MFSNHPYWRTLFGIGGSFSLLLATVVLAQPPADRPGASPPNRPARGFGPRGFGRPPGGGPLPVTMLLGMPEVQTELNLSPNQQTELTDLLAKTQEEMQTLFQSFGPPRFDAEPEEREKQLAAMRNKFDTLQRKTEGQVEALLEPAQRKRLQQLELQRSGAPALSRPEIAKKLALTESQQTDLGNLQGPGFGPPPAIQDALAILNDDQKTEWRKMAGKAFTFPEPPGFGPGGMGPPGFGPGGFNRQEQKLVQKFDKDSSGWLNQKERQAARDSLQKTRASGRDNRRGGFLNNFPRFGGHGSEESPKGTPGAMLSPTDVEPIADSPLYDPNVVRTLFLDFEKDDWEAELVDFRNTDVEVPCTLTVDGKSYPNVGVHFRGMSSYLMVPEGLKRSLNLSLDFVDADQRLCGYKTLNLLNAHADPSFLHTVLYCDLARNYLPAPKANFVRVVMNGESWGLYVNVQQFDKIFMREHFGQKGARWKVHGSPAGGGGLVYLGDDIDAYKPHYEIKSADKKQDWRAFIDLCRTLDQTPPEDLERALESKLDIDGALWFLALDNALISGDGYWVRASDYNICRDAQGKFHFVPHDMNEAFQPPMGPGFGGPGGRRPPGFGNPDAEASAPPAHRQADFNLDPLIGLDDRHKPLRSKLLAVPSLRAKYLQFVQTIAKESLNWDTLGPAVEKYAVLIGPYVEADTRKLHSYTAFQQAVGAEQETTAHGELLRHSSLKTFAQQRRKYLLDHPEVRKAVPRKIAPQAEGDAAIAR